MVKFEVADIILNCQTKPDLFSPKALDGGTRLLLASFALPSVIALYQDSIGPDAHILDWGCGWGAIGLWASKKWPDAHITAVDSDIAAIATTQENASINNVKNIEVVASHGFDQLGTDQKFDLIASNPPTHRGREVVDTMIVQSHERLNAGGLLVIVVEARLKPWVARQMTQVFGNHKIVKRGPKHVVLIAKK